MREFRLRLCDDLLPIQAYFNCWPDEDYLAMLRRAAAGIESTYNGIGWSWWNGEDETPPNAGTVAFFLADEEIAVPAKEAVLYFRLATDHWISHEPAHREEAIALITQLESLLDAPDARVC